MANTTSQIQLQSGFITNAGASVYPVSEIFRILDFPDIKKSAVININHKENIEKKIASISRGILFILCVNGNLQLKIDKNQYILNPYSICIILPGRKLFVLQKSQDLLTVFLHVTFSRDVLNAFLSEVEGIERFNSTPSFSIHREEATDILEFGSFIIKPYIKIDHPYHIEMTKKMLYALIYAIQDLYIKNEESATPLTENEAIFLRFRKLLIQYYPIREPSFYAEKLSYTPAYLSKIIKETSGKSISEWLDELILQQAKSLLTETNTTIASISRKLNFRDSNCFRFFFKKRTGLSPREYRKPNKS